MRSIIRLVARLFVRTTMTLLATKYVPRRVQTAIMTATTRIVQAVTKDSPEQQLKAFAFLSLFLLLFELVRNASEPIIARNAQSPKQLHPPRTAEFLLYLFLTRENRSAAAGDLEEEFSTIIVPKFGRRLAQLWYWKQVICSMPPAVWMLLRRVATIGTVAEAVRRFFKLL